MSGVRAADLRQFEVVIVGAGFSGVYQLIRLREEGFNVHLIEAGAGLGGIWHWNCYPGARVDTHCDIYQFSRPDLWESWEWSERFPGWAEMRAYFDHVDAHYDLKKDASLNTRVTAARFSDSTNRWRLETDQGLAFEAAYVVVCTGFGSKPYVPEIPGLETFEGEWHHTALWPQDGVRLDGRRVGVIGTGASGIQVAQESAKVAEKLTVFQRTPNMYLPMGQRALNSQDNEQMRGEYPERFDRRGKCFGGFDFDFDPRSALEVSDEEREATYERLWNAGGFHFWLGTFFDVFTDEKANRTAYDFWRRKTRARINDPAIAALLAPEEPPHPYAVKRPSLEQWYFDIFNYPNVELVSLKDTPVDSIEAQGVRLGERLLELDLLVFATGFDAVTGGITSIDIEGLSGEKIKDKWSRGVRTHLGVATAGFPNLLFSYGPQAPTGFCNGPSSAEYQGECLIEMLRDLRERGIERIEATEQAEASWREEILTMADATLFPKADSWYMGANIPGKPREMLMYPGGLPKYLESFEQSRANGYSGFELSK
ncbi:MAG: NAD(P)/FAD-dependent oxidoreductase [Pseudomonadota bacterium]